VVAQPYEVFVNGVRQTEGVDFSVVGSTLVFDRQLVPDRKLSYLRWLLLFIGVWSSYRHVGDSIDVVYTRDGARAVAHLKPRAPEPDA
jgi:hypothetical protein